MFVYVGEGGSVFQLDAEPLVHRLTASSVQLWCVKNSGTTESPSLNVSGPLESRFSENINMARHCTMFGKFEFEDRKKNDERNNLFSPGKFRNV